MSPLASSLSNLKAGLQAHWQNQKPKGGSPKVERRGSVAEAKEAALKAKAQEKKDSKHASKKPKSKKYVPPAPIVAIELSDLKVGIELIPSDTTKSNFIDPVFMSVLGPIYRATGTNR